MKPVLHNLHSRKFDMNLHRVWIDEDDGVATYPLWDLSGNMVGYQQYRPKADKKKKNNPKDSKYFTYVTKGYTGVWGLESWYLSVHLFVLEGVFDATPLTFRGVSAIALMQNDPNPGLRKWLMCVSKQRPLIFVCDGDQGGKPLIRCANRLGVPHEVVQVGKDLGEAPDSYVDWLVRKYNG